MCLVRTTCSSISERVKETEGERQVIRVTRQVSRRPRCLLEARKVPRGDCIACIEASWFVLSLA